MTDEAKKAPIQKGLKDVYADETKIAELLPEENALTYRGYLVHELAEKCSFEEVACLIWDGELPDAKKLEEFKQQERSLRALPYAVKRTLWEMRPGAHPMDVLRTSVSLLGTNDWTAGNSSPEALKMKSINLMAKIPTIVAATIRMKSGQSLLDPRDDLSFSENFFYMAFGEVPEPEIVKAFDASMILYAEHGFNASTFTARTIASTQSDIYSAVVGGIGALKGSLHGGANEAVMKMIEDIGTPENAEKWVLDALAEKKKIMGFGHAVYKSGDARVPVLNKLFNEVASLRPGGDQVAEIAHTVENTMMREKKLWPNVDFPAGPLYHLMGFEKEMFTPFFVMARITGWTAHVIEQRANNALIRPQSAYNGPERRTVIPMEQRGRDNTPPPPPPAPPQP